MHWVEGVIGRSGGREVGGLGLGDWDWEGRMISRACSSYTNQHLFSARPRPVMGRERAVKDIGRDKLTPPSSYTPHRCD